MAVCDNGQQMIDDGMFIFYKPVVLFRVFTVQENRGMPLNFQNK